MGFEGTVWEGTRVTAVFRVWRVRAVLPSLGGERLREFGKWLKGQENETGESDKTVRVEGGERGQAWRGTTRGWVKGTRGPQLGVCEAVPG